MEDVLTVYACPYDAKRLLVCMDEKTPSALRRYIPITCYATGCAERMDYSTCVRVPVVSSCLLCFLMVVSCGGS